MHSTVSHAMDVSYKGVDYDDLEVEVPIDKYNEHAIDKNTRKDFLRDLAAAELSKRLKTPVNLTDIKIDYKLGELDDILEDFNDTSDWHPNETFEEHMGHENMEYDYD